MTKTVLIKPLGGIAGDMFAGACAGLWPELCDSVIADCRAAGLPDGVAIRFEAVRVNGFAASHFHVGTDGGAVTPSGGYDQIVALLSASPLADQVKATALQILRGLGDAEAAVHGKPLESVHFHELAGWDSLADTVAAASFIARSGIADWRVGPIPLGGGTINTAHGIITCPAPAVLRLLDGFVLRDDGIMGERVTPTGAAILRHLCEPEAPEITGRLRGDAMGAGTRRFDGMANVTQLLIFEAPDHGATDRAATELVTEIAFDIDDMTPEEMAIALDLLRARTGVLDVTQTPQIGKKGRAIFLIRVLCRQEVSAEVEMACLTETSTLGLRIQSVRRRTLERQAHERKGLRVKSARRPDGSVTAKAESDDLAGHESLSRRRAVARAAEATLEPSND